MSFDCGCSIRMTQGFFFKSLCPGCTPDPPIQNLWSWDQDSNSSKSSLGGNQGWEAWLYIFGPTVKVRQLGKIYRIILTCIPSTISTWLVDGTCIVTEERCPWHSLTLQTVSFHWSLGCSSSRGQPSRDVVCMLPGGSLDSLTDQLTLAVGQDGESHLHTGTFSGSRHFQGEVHS